ncbi:hypothetical protein [Thermococcus sp.]|uniref:hypothetical protein n=1 Tax=Thermococcus sp. TaxID=35749 RepID=UPI00262377C0|nr:hypothetical protein [Thermococcus sp.]
MFDVAIGLWTLIWSLNIAGFLWVTYDVITKQRLMPESAKVAWIFTAFLFGSIVALVYALDVKRSGRYEEVELEGDEGVKVW